MTSRIQVLRSSVTGNVPTAGTRAAGEIWTNFSDLQLGTIDAARNAQRLIAVRYFSTAANYVAGDFVIQAGVLYVAKGAITAGAFNAANWTQVAAATDAGGPYLSVATGASTYLPLAGGTMTGLVTLSGAPSNPLHASTKAYADTMLPLAGGTMTGLVTLSGPPSNPLHAATKAYVDAGAFVPVAGGANTGLNDNRIINGDMRIDQRGVASSGGGTAISYTVDRWQYSGSQASKISWARSLGAGAPLFPYCLTFGSMSAYTPIAGDSFILYQAIEADAVGDFAWGTAGAQPVTLSFVAASSLTGTFSGAIKQYGASRAYPFTFSLPIANVFTKIVVTIPGDTGSTWSLSGNGGSVIVMFDFGSGSNNRGPANAWASSPYSGVTGSVSIVSTNGAAFYVTGVKLEIGSVATPYNRQSLAQSLVDCQRYYSVLNFWMGAYSGASGNFGQTITYPATMRAAPTITGSAFSYLNASGFNPYTVSNANAAIYCVSTATGQTSMQCALVLSAEL